MLVILFTSCCFFTLMLICIVIQVSINYYHVLLCQGKDVLNSFRKVIDGPGSETVFNGHEPVKDERYTLTNHFITGVVSTY